MTMINLYKYLGEIPEFVYRSHINNILLIEKNLSIHNVAWRENGTATSDSEILSLTTFDEHKDLALKTEKLKFKDLEKRYQEKLISLLLKKKYKVISKINIFLNKSVKNTYNENIVIRRKVKRFSAYKINDKFYIAINFKHELYNKKSLYDFYKEEITPLEKFKNKLVKTKPKEAIGEITDIFYPNTNKHSQEKEKIIAYYNQENPLLLENIDMNQPILSVKLNNNKIYSYFSQFLFPIIAIEDLSDKEICFLKIDNKEKSMLISETIINSKLQKIINPIPTEVNKVPLQNPKRIAFINVNGKLKKIHIDKISKILTKIKSTKIARTIYPIRVPDFIKEEKNKEIPIFIFADTNLSNKLKNSKIKFINELVIALKTLGNKDYFPKFYVKNRKILNLNNINKILEILLSYEHKSKIPPLVILLGSELQIKSKNDYYEDLKRILFSHNYISQNIIYEHLIKATKENINYELNALVFQILSKYGMYPYILEDNFEYDYIIGVDVGNDEYNNRTIAGALAIINKKGILESLLPVKINAKGEKVKLHYFLEKLISIKKLSLKNKRVLFLKDGLIYKDEIKFLYKNFRNYHLEEITLINVKKDNDFFFIENNNKNGIATFINEDIAILQSHQHPSAKPLKIDIKYKINKNKYFKEKIDSNDINLIYKLSFLNYSTILPEILRLPAPLHYAHKMISAIRKNWDIDNVYSSEGFLYFI